MTDRLTALLAERPWLLADGATGSNLFERGLRSGDAPELWNSEHPDRIAELHRGFVEAGADIILTNSFGGTRHRLKLHKAEERVAELNEKAARIARAEADRGTRVVLVGGSMGPTGEILEPLGPLSLDAAREAFAEQATALARGGADILWIETMSSIEETEAAIAGGRTTGLPIVATLSFDTNGRTMMGITPSELAGLHRKHHLAACGSNCGTGPSELVACIVNLAAASEPTAVLVAKANCGIPQFRDGEIRFNGSFRWILGLGSSAAAAVRRPATCASCARRSKLMCVDPSPASRPSNPASAPFRPVRRRSCAASSAVKRAPPPAQGLRAAPGAAVQGRKIPEAEVLGGQGYLFSTASRTRCVSYTSTTDAIRPVSGSKLNTSAHSNATFEPSFSRQS